MTSFPDKISRRIIQLAAPIQKALKQMDSVEAKLLIVFDSNKYTSLLSIGDIQRAIIRGVSLDRPVSEILRSNIRVGRVTDSKAFLKGEMKKFRMEFLPILDAQQNLVRVIFWEDLFSNVSLQSLNPIGCPVVVMAGGKGTRLKPITNVIPKPLIPIGEKPIIEWIVDGFCEQGAREFHFSVNYKKEMIQNYFAELPDRPYTINYFQEASPLGTAGSLHLLKGRLQSAFFVTNCDILIKEDYSAILDYHRSNGNQLTVVAAIKSYNIPYGILEAGEGGALKTLKEKPDLNFLINAGMYVLEPSLLERIPQDRIYHITDLMNDLIRDGMKVGVFPVSEGAWMDTGEWSEYIKTSKKMGFNEMGWS